MQALDSWLYRLLVCHICVKFSTGGNIHSGVHLLLVEPSRDRRQWRFQDSNLTADVDACYCYWRAEAG